jgi:pilus assembly protein Flp/PilA
MLYYQAGGTNQMQKVFLKGYSKIQGLANEFINDQSGQDLIEYALVVALIALAATAGMSSVATQINNAFTRVGSHLASYTS